MSLLVNIRQGLEDLPGTNTLAYLARLYVGKKRLYDIGAWFAFNFQILIFFCQKNTSETYKIREASALKLFTLVINSVL